MNWKAPIANWQSMEAAPEAGLTCYDSVDAAKALALPWPDLYYSPAWGAVELAAGASAWELEGAHALIGLAGSY